MDRTWILLGGVTQTDLLLLLKAVGRNRGREKSASTLVVFGEGDCID